MTISVPGLAANALSARAAASGSSWLVASSRMASLAGDGYARASAMSCRSPRTAPPGSARRGTRRAAALGRPAARRPARRGVTCRFRSAPRSRRAARRGHRDPGPATPARRAGRTRSGATAGMAASLRPAGAGSPLPEFRTGPGTAVRRHRVRAPRRGRAVPGSAGGEIHREPEERFARERDAAAITDRVPGQAADMGGNAGAETCLRGRPPCHRQYRRSSRLLEPGVTAVGEIVIDDKTGADAAGRRGRAACASPRPPPAHPGR